MKAQLDKWRLLENRWLTVTIEKHLLSSYDSKILKVGKNSPEIGSKSGRQCASLLLFQV